VKRNEIAHTAMVLCMLLGTDAFGYAQQEDKGGEKDKRGKQAEPVKQQGQKRAQPQQNARPQQRAGTQESKQQSARIAHVQVERTPGQQRAQQVQQQGVWQQHRARNFDSEHRNWQQRGGYSGYRFPDAYFSSNFGTGHSFRVYDLPFLEVGGYPRFQYEGYWFSVIDPYPEYWGTDWYRSDDMYVDYYEDGYYLYDRRYPGRPGIAISISM
jgi:hypothetical protein